ncbi:MAG: hypothetical protein F9K19_21585 [Rhizobiaceae bacterium]|nr:MAG: hypothetical protein F9K19_21585 [Rhizobiaceae bacterium]CAG1008113.1 hypothetical protein RHIZO_03456 [Rhizobiaceae bacterium]
MALRPPSGPVGTDPMRTGIGVLDYEIAGEMASSLGRAGERVASTLAALARAGEGAARNPALRAAADAVYAYFIQRELCGLRRHDDAIREYAIPREVLVRLGAR